MEKSVQMIVIGGGISGLCAAKLLALEHGISVTVLEARNRVGGRTNTLEDPKFKYTDLGGAYVGPTQNRILRVAKELGVQTYKVYNQGSTVELLDGKRRVFAGDVSTWNPIAILDYYNMIRVLDKMGEEIPLDQPWNAPKATEWDSMTVKEFLDKTCWSGYTKKTHGTSLQRCNGCRARRHVVVVLSVVPQVRLWSAQSCSYWDAGQERKFMGGSQTN
ncbi:hypothetical protein OS493_026323 [Desmophyllum pertusum]|uniref:Amine oxidase n=1 Tax=Desmophyllum pertusum TaxID=174260 RepID=A0A9X0D3S8_9CNID|nr:hypothetical protein OS493_026323 [Desmophyllum pertusum]